MHFVKQHKYWFIAVGIILLLMIISFIAIKDSLFPNSSKSVYGNRLDGINDVRIDNDRFDKLKQTLNANEKVESTSIYLKGKIIDVIIDVKKDVDHVSSKALAETIMTEFSDAEKAYYDFQVYIACKDDENDLYPIIGYKHRTSNNFVWTNNS